MYLLLFISKQTCADVLAHIHTQGAFYMLQTARVDQCPLQMHFLSLPFLLS